MRSTKAESTSQTYVRGRYLLTDSCRFIFATESYGGHYGPEFVTFFNEQNAKIKSGSLKGELINVSALMINKYASDLLRTFFAICSS